MTREDTKKILSTTRKDVEKDVRAKFKIKKIEKKYPIFLNDLLLSNGDSVSNFIKKINHHKKVFVKATNVLDSEVKIKPYGYNTACFFGFIKETNKEFETRCRRSISQRFSKIKMKQNVIRNKEKAKMDRVIKVIKEFDGDIYEVFKKINE